MERAMKNRNNFGTGEPDCIEPAVGGKVYDYYNGALGGEEAAGFERHLIRCGHCERLVLDLDNALAALNDEQGFDLVGVSEASSGVRTLRRKKG
jgi:hypothetical protein